MTTKFQALAAALVMVTVTAPSIAQERKTMPTFSFSEGIKQGDCKIAFRSLDGVTMVDFGLGIMDSVFSVEVVRPSWAIVKGKDINTKNKAVTIKFQNDKATSSEFGGYRDGMYQGVWGMWHGKDSDPVQSQRGLERLMEASSANVSFDGKQIASVNLGPTGFAANKLLDCAIAERKKQR